MKKNIALRCICHTHTKSLKGTRCVVDSLLCAIDPHRVRCSKIDSIKIVPIMVGSITAEKEKIYGEALAPYLSDPATLFIVSSDFCHWYVS